MREMLVGYEPGESGRGVIEREIEGLARVTYLPDVASDARGDALSSAAVMLSRNIAHELADGEAEALGALGLLQLVTAGVDFVPLDAIPAAVPIAANRGAYAEPMAEHALAMVLASLKRLATEHANLARGEFNQFTANRMLSGLTVGILGFGGIGVATARVMRALGAKVHAMNRRGHCDEPVDWVGPVERLDELLAVSDVLVLSLPLTVRTERMLGARELELMPEDATLVNLARGEIIDEWALYRHLEGHPRFTACIDAWWVEPVRHGEFRMQAPFFDLDNVLASPHNSASVVGWGQVALARAMENCRRVLRGEAPHHLVDDEERAPRAG